MQKHALIGFGDVHHLTHLLSSPPLDIAHDDHLSLRGRQLVDRGTDQPPHFAREYALSATLRLAAVSPTPVRGA